MTDQISDCEDAQNPDNWFKCKDTGWCIDKLEDGQWCNMEPDCEDKSDEENCSNHF